MMVAPAAARVERWDSGTEGRVSTRNGIGVLALVRVVGE